MGLYEQEEIYLWGKGGEWETERERGEKERALKSLSPKSHSHLTFKWYGDVA